MLRGRHNPACRGAGYKPPEYELLARVFERLFVPAFQNGLAAVEQILADKRLVAVRVKLVFNPHDAVIKGVVENTVKVGFADWLVAADAVAQAPFLGLGQHFRQRMLAGRIFLEQLFDQRRALGVGYDDAAPVFIPFVEIAERGHAHIFAHTDFLVERAADIILHAIDVGLRHNDAHRPHKTLLAHAVLVNDVIFGIEMQLDLAALDQIVKQRVFAEGALHPVNLVGNDGGDFLLGLDEFNHVHEFAPVALGGRFHNLENLQDFEAAAGAIGFKAVLLRVYGISFFLFPA